MALADMDDPPGWRIGEAWEIWIRELTLVRDKAHLPTGARTDDLAEQSAFTNLVAVLKNSCPAGFDGPSIICPYLPGDPASPTNSSGQIERASAIDLYRRWCIRQRIKCMRGAREQCGSEIEEHDKLAYRVGPFLQSHRAREARNFTSLIAAAKSRPLSLEADD